MSTDGGLPDQPGGQVARPVALDGDDVGMLVDEVADVVDVALGQDLALVDEDDLAGQGLDLGQDVARDEDRPALVSILLDEPDDLALAQRIQPVERLVEDR